jgi:hypothetical protein
MLKIIRNPNGSDVEVRDTGITILANSSYTIPPQDFWLWAASSDAVSKIVSDDIIVNDGQDDLVNKRVAIALLQDNQVVLNEYYTLVQGDDILVGNGQILYLNDDFDTSGNVPDYLDEQIEEDDPTEN